MRCKRYELRVPSITEALGAIFIYLPAFALVEVRSVDSLRVLVLTAVLILIHEGTHVFTIVILTRNLPSMGVGPYYVYVSTKKPIRRNQYVIIALSTLVGLSLVLQILYRITESSDLAILYLMNLIGSSGDFILALESLAYPEDSWVEDKGSSSYFCVKGWRPPRWLDKFRPFLRRVALTVPLSIAISFPIGVRTSVKEEGPLRSLELSLDQRIFVLSYILGLTLAFLWSLTYNNSNK